MAKRWIILNSPGAAGPPGASGASGTAPDAPNVTAATVTVTYLQKWNSMFYHVSGSITVPTSDPNIAQDRKLHLYLVDQSTSAVIPFQDDLIAPAGGNFASSVPYLSQDWEQQTDVDRTFKLRVTAENSDGKITATPFETTAFTVNKRAVTALSIVEGARTIDGPNRGVITTLTTTISLANNQVPQIVTFWLSRDNGTTKLWQGSGLITSSPQTLTLPWDWVNPRGYYPPDVTDETWILYADTGYYVDGQAVPATAFASAPLTVPHIPNAAATLVSAASIDSITYPPIPGAYQWLLNNIRATAPFSTHPELIAIRFYVAWGKLVGGVWTINSAHPVTSFTDAFPGDSLTTGDSVVVSWGPHNMPDQAGPDITAHIWITAITRYAGGTEVQQNCWPSSGGPSSEIVYNTSFVAVTPSAAYATATRGPAPDAPAVTSGWISNLALVYQSGNNYTIIALTGTVTPPGGTDCTHLRRVRAVAILSGRRTEIDVPGTWAASSGNNFSIALNDILDPAAGTLSYYAEFTSFNDDSKPTTPYTSSALTAVPAPIASLGGSEAGPRVRVGIGGVVTTISVPITFTSNPAGSGGIVQTTLWFVYDRDNTGTPLTLWQGWYPVTGTSTTISVPNTWITSVPTGTTFTIRAWPGPIDGNLPIPSGAASHSFTMSGPSDPASNLLSNAALSIKYAQGSWQPTITYTAPFSTNAQLKSTRITVQHVNSGGTADSVYGERNVADIDLSVTASLNGDAVTYTTPPWPYPATGELYPIFRLKLKADGPNEVWITESAWPSSGGPAGVAYHTSYADVTPDPSLGAFPPAQAPTPPTPTGFTAGVVSYSTNPRGSGKPVWRVGTTLGQPTAYNIAVFPNGTDLSYVTEIHMIAVGIGEIGLTVAPFTLDGNGNPRLRNSNYVPRDTVGQTYDIQIVTENATGQQASYTATGAITTTGTGNLDGYYTISPSGGVAVIDLSYGRNQQLVLTGSGVTIQAPIFTAGVINAGEWFVLYVDQDATGGRAKPSWTTGAGGFASDVAGEEIVTTASTRSTYQFTFHGGVWCLDAPIRTGGAIS